MRDNLDQVFNGIILKSVCKLPDEVTDVNKIDPGLHTSTNLGYAESAQDVNKDVGK